MTLVAALSRSRSAAITNDVPLALVGPTAGGKSEASVELARRLGAEVVLIDSATVYRGMDVGTAKPSAEERGGVPHHLIDVADPFERFSVARFQAMARRALHEITSRGRAAILVGGSGLYYRAVVDGLEFPGTAPTLRGWLETEARALGPERLHLRLAAFDPVAAAKIEPGNVRRTVRALEVAALTGRPFSSFAKAWDRYPQEHVRAAGVTLPPDVLRDRIEARVEAMLTRGLVDEVRDLVERGADGWVTAAQAIGYVEIARHLAGRMSLDQARERIVRRTRALARRQMAWFRRDPRIRWFEAGPAGAAGLVDSIEEYYTT